ncbi:contactin-like [Gigantopelta aegis]|uniref:contactin-like n=1 Tax=Gigantopelta aegis TaxID=1735272 RepID=UPI001B88BB99|nr:contactin-like [Gigantopelta aegis]
MIKLIIFLSLTCVVQAAQVFNCERDWFLYDDARKCYRFVAFPQKNYADSTRMCRQDGASLVSINSVGEHNFIAQRLSTDQRRDDWFTSGSVSARSKSIIWRGDSTSSSTFEFWINKTNAQMEGRTVVYTYSGNAYGWGIAETDATLSFICEIDQSQAYKIVQESRDFDYGLDTVNFNEIPRGPKFLVQPIETTILGATSAVYLECVAFSIPQPSYKWLKKVGQIYTYIVPNENYTLTNGRLTIHDPKKSAESDYYCEAKNDAGLIRSKTVQLSFGVLGEFSNVQTAPVEAWEHMGSQLQCPSINHKPALKYQWYKNSITQFIRPSYQKHIFISGHGKLYFSEVNRPDAGTYHCIVILTTLGSLGNYIGSSQSPSKTSLGFKLVVKNKAASNYQPIIQDDFPAVFPTQPKRGMYIQIECFAYGTGPLTYSWIRHNKAMPNTARLVKGSNNRILAIDNVQFYDQGTYECRVQSGSLSDRKLFTLQIQSEPFFTYNLTDQHVDVGSKLIWYCEADGRPIPTYSWYKNGQPITNVSGVISASRNRLVIEKLDKDRDSGMYQCAATNSHGTTLSSGQIRVLEFKPNFRKTPLEKRISAARGGNVTIVCNPESAPQAEYQWLKDGRSLGLTKGSESGNLHMLMNGNIYITGLRMSDGGRYTCRVENRLGISEDFATLTIVDQTRITRGPSPTTVTINSTATLICEASVNPTIDLIYSWHFNDHVIDVDEDPHYRLGDDVYTKGYLYIINSQYQHSGYYTCHASTGLDVVTASAVLTVIGPPGEPAGVFPDASGSNILQKRSKKIVWSDGDDHGANILYYDVEFNTNFNEKWRILKERILVQDTLDEQHPDKHSTVLENLKPGANYRFRVRSMNRYGMGLPSLPTTEIHIPGDRPYVAPAMVSGGGGRVGLLVIVWMPLPPEDANGNGVGYRVFWRKKPLGITESRWKEKALFGQDVNTYTALVGSENYYREYEVRVQAFNEFGSGNMSHIATIYSAEDLPYGTPRSVHVFSFNSTAMRVAWIPVPDNREYMKGRLIGYKVNYWRKGKETEIQAVQQILQGQRESGLIIGLEPNTWYSVTVQVYNSAGNGPKSEFFHQITDRRPPQNYPTEVHIYSYSKDRVRVSFRGVSTQAFEEPLQGYKVKYWRVGEDIRKARIFDCKKSFDSILPNIEEATVYQLRVYGYSRGGQGKMSSPATLFTLGGMVTNIINPATTDIIALGCSTTPSVLLTIGSVIALWSIH